MRIDIHGNRERTPKIPRTSSYLLENNIPVKLLRKFYRVLTRPFIHKLWMQMKTCPLLSKSPPKPPKANCAMYTIKRPGADQQKAIGNEVLWWLEIPYPLLRSWSGSGLNVEKLNSACEEAALPLRSPNKRIEENVRVQVTAVVRKYKAVQRVGGNSAKKLNRSYSYA